ncbi:hypothetical protein KEM56_006985 [Ascosphaera pollenicola]|nr:hypothetical protein KEM56_006985 [Ascosphaera pollenicola]
MTTSSFFPQVLQHFQHIIQDPSATRLDEILLRCVAEQVDEHTEETVLLKIVSTIAQLLPVLQDDPSILEPLLKAVISYLSFAELRAIDPPIDIVQGLTTANERVNILALTLLETGKADFESSESVAEDPELVSSLVQLFLTTGFEEVSERAEDLIINLLKANLGEEGDSHPGRLWQRIFGDRAIYCSILSTCGFMITSVGDQHHVDRSQTISQARILDLVPKIAALNWEHVAETDLSNPDTGEELPSLLDYATNHMIDASDPLMLSIYLDFAMDLISGDDDPRYSGDIGSPALRFLMDCNVHQKIFRAYIGTSTFVPMALPMFKEPVTLYIARYVGLYPNHLLTQPPEDLDALLNKLHDKIDIPKSEWAHHPNNSEDLTILACLPRLVLLRQRGFLEAIPSEYLNKDTLLALGRLFGTTCSEDAQLPETGSLEDLTNQKIEAAAARLLYLRYTHKHPDFWEYVSKAIDMPQFPEVASASLALVRDFLVARWERETDPPHLAGKDRKITLPTDDELRKELGVSDNVYLPESGLSVIMSPPALQTILPSLMKTERHSSMARYDQEHGWQHLVSKFETLKLLQMQLTKEGARDKPALKQVIEKIDKRVAEGVVARQESPSYPQVATASK